MVKKWFKKYIEKRKRKNFCKAIDAWLRDRVELTQEQEKNIDQCIQATSNPTARQYEP